MKKKEQIPCVVETMSKPWKQAASLMVLARKSGNLSNKSRFDYKTLLLKRSPTMRFAANASVFPGGNLDQHDLSLDWIDLFSSSVGLERFRDKKAQIYSDIDHPFPGLVFRLCAIRETFEETGLLLAKPNSKGLTPEESEKWRKLVRHDASKFLQLCKENRIEPDVWSLFEWSQYLAPAFVKVRYDTIFYATFLPEPVPCTIDPEDKETSSADWIEPDAAIKGYRENQIDFLPPQIVELSSLANFAKISDLKHFLTKRSDSPDYSTKRKLGICFKVRDGVALVLPGDDFYPPDSSFETPVFVLDKTLADFECPNKNRLVTRKDDPNRRWSIEFRRDSSKVRSDFDVFPLSTDDQIRSNL